MSTTAGYALGFENGVEQREAVALSVQGSIPSWLTGSLYRTGPGTYRIPSQSAPGGVVNVPHWFDGLGTNHRFEIQPGGTVRYNNHSSAEGRAKDAAEKGVLSGFSFGEDPCKKIFDKFFTTFEPPAAPTSPPPPPGPSDRNISVTLSPDMPGFAGHPAIPPNAAHYIVAKTDSNALQLLHAETLEPLAITRYTELDPRLDGELSAAHSCWDRSTGEFFNFCLKFGNPPVFKVFKIRAAPKDTADPSKPDASVDVLAEIDDAPAAYLHSFVLTQKYVVLCVWQADFSHGGGGLLIHNSFVGGIQDWNPERDAVFYVIDRNGGLVSKFKTPPFFCFHAINAYDAGDDVVIDLSVYDDHSVLRLLHLDKLRNLNAENHMVMGRARRFVLAHAGRADRGVRAAAVAYTSPHTIELPTIHPALYHRPHRYAYGISKLDPRTHHTFVDGLIKLDLSDPAAAPARWRVPGYTAGEPIFVPRPGATAEDDGVLLSVVLDGETQRSMMAVLDAKDMTEVARAEMGAHVPYGFHGAFVPAVKAQVALPSKW